jgi:hypothetical protein
MRRWRIQNVEVEDWLFAEPTVVSVLICDLIGKCTDGVVGCEDCWETGRGERRSVASRQS